MAIAALVAAAVSAQALPVKRVATQMQQPDGSVVTLTPIGDEYVHYFITTDKQVVLPVDGAFYYAQVGEDGTLTPTDILASDPEKRDNLQANFLSTVKTDQMRQAIRATRDASPLFKSRKALGETYELQQSRASDRPWEGLGLFTNRDFPKTGSPKGMVILVEYQDVKFTQSDEDTYDYFYRMLNEEGFSDQNAVGSARDYFRDASNGVFTPEFEVFGPVTLSQDRAYYGGNSPYTDYNVGKMIMEAIDSIAAQDVDFSVFCNGSKSSRVDNVFVFYAGVGEAQVYPTLPDAVWPHNSELRYYEGANYLLGYKAGGVYFNNYACSSELLTTTMLDGIGTFVHEFSHVMGLPDLYSTDYSEVMSPGDFSVLDSGPYLGNSRIPPTYSAFERNAMGWIDLIQLTDTQDLEIEYLGDSNVAYVATTDVDTEFYLFENRQRTNWDKKIPYYGMLVWHIDYVKSVWNNNEVNNDADHQYVDLVEASMPASAYASHAQVPFPGTKKKTEFTPETDPAFLSWSGESCGLALTDIACKSGENVTLKVTNTAGITAVTVDGGASIVANGLSVTIDGAKDAQVFDIAGRIVAVGEGTHTLPAAGLYIVRTATSSTKILAR